MLFRPNPSVRFLVNEKSLIRFKDTNKVMDNTMKKDDDKSKEHEKVLKKRLIIFLAVSISLLIIGGYLLFTHESKTDAEKFYHDRKNAQYHQEYRESRGSKEKSERNIFLQD